MMHGCSGGRQWQRARCVHEHGDRNGPGPGRAGTPGRAATSRGAAPPAGEPHGLLLSRARPRRVRRVHVLAAGAARWCCRSRAPTSSAGPGRSSAGQLPAPVLRPDFLKVLGVTAAFTVLTVIPSILVALVIALLLQGRIRGVRFFRTAFALPFAFSVATASVIFQVLYNPASGVLNGLLSYVGRRAGALAHRPGPGAVLGRRVATVWMQLGYNLLVPQRRPRRPARGRPRGGAARRRLRAAGCSARSSCR